MLDAKSARVKSMQADKGCSDAELEVIERKIVNACTLGHTSVSIKGQILSTTIKRLEVMGYVVQITDDQRDGSWTTISW